MQVERWERIQELFEAAQQQPADQRAAFLRESCPTDPELCSQVESLLRAAESGNSLLDGSPLSYITERAPALKSGDKLGNFQIVALIGRGGMGEVYRAHDLRLKRDVAIKTLPPDFAADRDRIARFEREARAASMLNHPNIVSVFDVGRDSGLSFIVSELIEGETLAQVIARGPLPLRKLVEVGAQVCEGLAAAHAAGVIHRDLKPGNIMLTRDGRVKILDFGLAHQERGPATENATMEFSHPGTIFGTPAYMSPEQARAGVVDARSDIFTLGAVLYEMASGKRAFQGPSSIEVMNSVLKDEPPELSTGRRGPLDRTIRRCVEKEPNRRFQSASDLRFALVALSDTQDADRPWRTPVTWAKWLAAATVALCLGAGVTYFLRERSPSSSIRKAGRFLRLTSDAGLATNVSISPDGKLVTYASDRTDSNNLDIWVQQVDGRGMARITEDPADDYDPTFSPDGAQIAFRSDRENGGIYVVPVLGGDARLLIPEGRRPRYSPSGQMMLYWLRTGTFTNALFIRSAPGVAPLQIGAGCDVEPSSAVWSPDGRLILFNGRCGSSPQNQLWVSSLDGKRTAGPTGFLFASIDQWLSAPSRLLFHVRASDGDSMALVPISDDGTKLTGQWERLTMGTEKEGQASAAADGRIAFTTQNSETHIWGFPIDSSGHATGIAKRLTTHPSQQYESYPVLSRDGKGLVFVCRAEGTQNLFYKDLATGRERELSSGMVAQIGEAFSPDAKTVLFQGSTFGPKNMLFSVYQVPVSGGTQKRVWGEQPNTQMIWDWSPDGATVLYLSADTGKMTELELKSLSKLQFLDEPGYDVYQGHFSRDGRWVAFNGIHNGQSHIYVAPFRRETVPHSEWIQVTDGRSDDKPRFSADEKLIFFTSDRDGFVCLWAERIGSDLHPTGTPFAVYHYHQRRRSLATLGSEFQTDVGPNRIVFNQAELLGNIWLLDPGP